MGGAVFELMVSGAGYLGMLRNDIAELGKKCRMLIKTPYRRLSSIRKATTVTFLLYLGAGDTANLYQNGGSCKP